jgi:hypothetical protein
MSLNLIQESKEILNVILRFVRFFLNEVLFVHNYDKMVNNKFVGKISK